MATEKKPSKATQMRARKGRTRTLYLRGYRPPEICDVLIDEGHFSEESSPKASLGWVQEYVAEIRAEAEPETVLALQRPAETERYRQRMLELYRAQLAIRDDDSMVERQAVTPKGDVVTVSEFRWPPGVRQKAAKDCALLIEKLARLERVDVDGEIPPDDPAGAGKGKSEPLPAFQFVMSGKPMDALIALNVEPGKVN